MIPIRLPWRHRARPSATLHEIQVCPERQTCSYDATQPGEVRQSGIFDWSNACDRSFASVAKPHFSCQFSRRSFQPLDKYHGQRVVKTRGEPRESMHDFLELLHGNFVDFDI